MTLVSLTDKVQQDMVAAMKSREVDRLSTLRMMKSALKNKEIDKRAPLTDAEAEQVLVTMVKQRRDSIEQFTKGNRMDLVEKEAAEIPIIESYLPKSASPEDIRSNVEAVIAEMSAAGSRPTPRDMGGVMKAVQAKFQAAGLRADGKLVSEQVKAALAN
ncbi:MAG: GatB/YqeY domain-containing protein [Acidobacteriaceae bacterium]